MTDTPKRACILFAGNMGAGKDTAADMLAQAISDTGVSVLRIAFADPVKDIALHLLGIPKSVTYGSQQDKLDYQAFGKSARYWLQWIGTELGRQQIHFDIWAHRFIDRALSSDAQVVIGSDCRFLNEITLTREQLGPKMHTRVIRIENPNVALRLEHQSEREIHDVPATMFDHIIRNDKDLGALRVCIKQLAKSVLQSLV